MPAPHHNPALSNTEEAIHVGPGKVAFVTVSNPHPTTDAYLLLYDAESAVTPGTTVPEQWGRFLVRASTDRTIPVGTSGAAFSQGLRWSAAQNINGTVAPATALDCTVAYSTRA